MARTSRDRAAREEERFLRELASQWGESVLKARHSRKMTQRALADRAGLTQQTVSKVEAGKLLPSERSKFRLAQALDTSVAVLFEWPH